LGEGCRAASKTEYESAKRDFLLQTDQMIPTLGKLSKRIAKEVRYFICHARGKERNYFGAM
jgi:hypothetical protein